MSHASARAQDPALVAVRHHIDTIERALARVLATDRRLAVRVEELREEAAEGGVDLGQSGEGEDDAGT